MQGCGMVQWTSSDSFRLGIMFSRTNLNVMISSSGDTGSTLINMVSVTNLCKPVLKGVNVMATTGWTPQLAGMHCFMWGPSQTRLSQEMRTRFAQPYHISFYITYSCI